MFASRWLAPLKGKLTLGDLDQTENSNWKSKTDSGCFLNFNIFREIVSLRDRVKRNYSYVCGLMVMLVKICESRKGLEVFSLRNGLLIILSELLLFAPQVRPYGKSQKLMIPPFRSFSCKPSKR